MCVICFPKIVHFCMFSSWISEHYFAVRNVVNVLGLKWKKVYIFIMLFSLCINIVCCMFSRYSLHVCMFASWISEHWFAVRNVVNIPSFRGRPFDYSQEKSRRRETLFVQRIILINKAKLFCNLWFWMITLPLTTSRINLHHCF